MYPLAHMCTHRKDERKEERKKEGRKEKEERKEDYVPLFTQTCYFQYMLIIFLNLLG